MSSILNGWLELALIARNAAPTKIPKCMFPRMASNDARIREFGSGVKSPNPSVENVTAEKYKWSQFDAILSSAGSLNP